MPYKYGPRKRHNAGTTRKTTVFRKNRGSRTRVTNTVRTGNWTRSRSVNEDSTIHLTETHRAPNGIITRRSKTIGAKVDKTVDKPNFIKPKSTVIRQKRIRSLSSKAKSNQNPSFSLPVPRDDLEGENTFNLKYTLLFWFVVICLLLWLFS